MADKNWMPGRTTFYHRGLTESSQTTLKIIFHRLSYPFWPLAIRTIMYSFTWLMQLFDEEVTNFCFVGKGRKRGWIKSEQLRRQHFHMFLIPGRLAFAIIHKISGNNSRRITLIQAIIDMKSTAYLRLQRKDEENIQGWTIIKANNYNEQNKTFISYQLIVLRIRCVA